MAALETDYAEYHISCRVVKFYYINIVTRVYVDIDITISYGDNTTLPIPTIEEIITPITSYCDNNSTMCGIDTNVTTGNRE